MRSQSLEVGIIASGETFRHLAIPIATDLETEIVASGETFRHLASPRDGDRRVGRDLPGSGCKDRRLDCASSETFCGLAVPIVTVLQTEIAASGETFHRRALPIASILEAETVASGEAVHRLATVREVEIVAWPGGAFHHPTVPLATILEAEVVLRCLPQQTQTVASCEAFRCVSMYIATILDQINLGVQ